MKNAYVDGDGLATSSAKRKSEGSLSGGQKHIFPPPTSLFPSIGFKTPRHSALTAFSVNISSSPKKQSRAKTVQHGKKNLFKQKEFIIRLLSPAEKIDIRGH